METELIKGIILILVGVGIGVSGEKLVKWLNFRKPRNVQTLKGKFRESDVLSLLEKKYVCIKATSNNYKVWIVKRGDTVKIMVAEVWRPNYNYLTAYCSIHAFLVCYHTVKSADTKKIFAAFNRMQNDSNIMSIEHVRKEDALDEIGWAN